MWDNLVGHEIRRSTRNVIFWNLLLLAGLLAISVASSRYLYSLFAGPFRLETADLLAQQKQRDFPWKYVTVTAKEVHRTAWRDITQTVDRSGKVKSEEVTANYSLLVVDNKILVVRHDPEVWPATTCSGRLLPLPNHVRTTFLARENPEMQGAFLNLLLDQTTFWRRAGYIGLALGVLLALFALRNLVRSVRFRNNAYQHPQLKRLAARGDMEELLAALEQQSANAERFGDIRLMSHWLLRSKLFGFDLVPLVDIAWGTMCTTRSYTCFVPTGTTFTVELYDLNRRKYRFDAASEKQGMNLLSGIVARVPWVLIGGEELQTAWKNNPGQVLEVVEERRKTYLQYSAQDGASPFGDI